VKTSQVRFVYALTPGERRAPARLLVKWAEGPGYLRRGTDVDASKNVLVWSLRCRTSLPNYHRPTSFLQPAYSPVIHSCRQGRRSGLSTTPGTVDRDQRPSGCIEVTQRKQSQAGTPGVLARLVRRQRHRLLFAAPAVVYLAVRLIGLLVLSWLSAANEESL